MSIVGQNIPHDSAVGHVSGQSLFLDDVAPLRAELLVDVVGSPVAHGEIVSINLDEARKLPGVVALFTHKDVPGHNHIGPVLKDEDLLVEKTAQFVGAPIVLIAAETRAAIAAAKKAITIDFKPLPAIFSIDQALAADSFLSPERIIQRGDINSAFASAKNILEGSLTTGGQEHFYLESQIALAYPGEGNTLTVHSSTQHPSEVQMMVAEVIGIPFNHVTCICKRMGGGFGGKETQAAQPAAMAALVAHLTKRPARLALSKDDDMRITGKRHPFKGFYRVAFDDEGRILALDLKLYANGGFSLDLSSAVFERALLHADNAYYIPHFSASGRICKTNLPSNTAFRGFGGPQGVINIENILEEIALKLNLDALDVRRRNMYGAPRLSPSPGNPGEGRGEGLPPSHDNLTTPYGQLVTNNTLPQLFTELPERCDYHARRKHIDSFNATSRTMVKGMSLTAVKFGISFTRRAMNQANALVNLYQDGTAIVSTGGTEMGQGVNTRIRQLVADDLGISYDKVIVAATATDKNNNTSPTAASSGTDLNGAAALDACAKLRARLAVVASSMLGNVNDGLNPEPGYVAFDNNTVFDARNPRKKISFKDLCCQAYELRVNLGERGFYATPGVDYNRETGKGHPFLYFTNGVACAEVVIDRFTGDYRVTRVDLLMDIGQSINPGIDRGQIVGGFIQGMGWCTTEELRYAPDGQLQTHSPTTYKIPDISDVPEIFNVHTIDNPNSTVSLKKSKAVGEPPLLLGACVFTAIKNALSYAAPGTIPPLSLPATPEEVLMTLTRLGALARTPATVR
ncbi:MAG TPA: xanthine dehydrogenase molybdopterin binding subunit [Tepidisphaeraceae bacterium]|jgi:xanthine dehydrogenase large subunit